MEFFGLAWVIASLGGLGTPHPHLRDYLPRFFSSQFTVGFSSQRAARSCRDFSLEANCLRSPAQLAQWSASLPLWNKPAQGITRLFRPDPVLQSVADSLSRWSRRTMFVVAAVNVRRSFPTTAVSHAALNHAAPSRSAATGFQQCITEVQSDEQLSNSQGYEVWVNSQRVAVLPLRSLAQQFANRLRPLLQDPNFDPVLLRAAIANGQPVGMAGNVLLFEVSRNTEQQLHRSADLLAIDWINNLRVALGAAPVTLVDAQVAMYDLARSSKTMQGTASWYGPYFHNRPTATGERFDQNELTAAHPSLPFDTYLKVTNLENRQSVIVRINDRGPYVEGRSLDLSRQAARCISGEEIGVVPYKAVIMKPVTEGSKLMAELGETARVIQLAKAE